jgi:hypothetical protein
MFKKIHQDIYKKSPTRNISLFCSRCYPIRKCNICNSTGSLNEYGEIVCNNIHGSFTPLKTKEISTHYWFIRPFISFFTSSHHVCYCCNRTSSQRHLFEFEPHRIICKECYETSKINGYQLLNNVKTIFDSLQIFTIQPSISDFHSINFVPLSDLNHNIQISPLYLRPSSIVQAVTLKQINTWNMFFTQFQKNVVAEIKVNKNDFILFFY